MGSSRISLTFMWPLHMFSTAWVLQGKQSSHIEIKVAKTCAPRGQEPGRRCTAYDPATKDKQCLLPHILFTKGNHRGSPCVNVLDEHVGLKILLKPVLENIVCHKSFRLFKSSEQLYNTNVKILFGSLTF